jgi:SAM-dependent methyltransferase
MSEFDKAFWDEHWRDASAVAEVNPQLIAETAGLTPGRALDAGAGLGNEANWLASQGWDVTAVDISADERTRAPGVHWLVADVTTWTAPARFDLVTTHYAHAAMPQVELYTRIGEWVVPGGTLLIVGHLHGGEHPGAASVTPDAIVAHFPGWRVDTAEIRSRTLQGHVLDDVVVRLTRPKDPQS